MKNIFILITLLFCYNIGNAQWNSLPTPFVHINNFAVTNDSSVYCINDYSGKFYSTHNGGQSWEGFLTEYEYEMFYDIDFVNDSVGFICGGGWFSPHRNIIMKTRNAGLTWETLTEDSIGIYQYVLFNIEFINEDSGMVFGYGYQFLRTLDGGQNWNPIFVNTTINESSINDIFFVNGNLGFVTTNTRTRPNNNTPSKIYRTTDFGTTWELVYSATDASDLRKIHFVNDQIGYVSGGNGTLLKTEDGGNTWSLQNIWPYNMINALWFTDENNGYANIAGIIQKTSDGGITWNPQMMNSPNIVTSIAFSKTGQTGYLVADGKVYKTGNGGGPTTDILSKPPKSPFHIFPNPAQKTIQLEYATQLKIKEIRLLDITGRIVKTFEPNQKQLQISGIVSGSYFLHIQTDNGETVEKIIVR